MTINVFYIHNFQLKCILNPNIEKFIRCIAINTGKSNELAVYYDQEVMIYDIEDEKIKEKIKINSEARYLEFNTDNKLLIVTKNEELFVYDLITKKISQIKTSDKVLLAKWYPFNVN